MLNLTNKLTLDEAAIKAVNLCDRFITEDLNAIGAWVSDGYKMDKVSRQKWEVRNAAAMDLAMQIQKAKNFPWPNASNVAFPLITIATMQFHATAYPSLISGTDIVRCRTIGDDPSGVKKARADRVSTHMSWQRLEEDQPWEEQHDRGLINRAVIGCNFMKSYYNSTKAHNVSELVYANDLVMDYWSKSVEDSPRKTHVVPLFRNEIWERVKSNTFRDVLNSGWYTSNATPRATTQTAQRDNRTGQLQPSTPDETTPFRGLEQHCSLDLDQDGYAEPYIITIEETSKDVLRIVTRFDRLEDIEKTAGGEIIKIFAMEYFTKYPFLPSPDGGIYDMGFGVLLGPLNESASTIINQLIDVGTMASTAGGFLGRGAKIRGGSYTFSPLEWKRVDSTGDDLNKSIVPLPVREPSAVLFQLLSLIINYTNRVAGSNDAQVGENPGQNTPAETQRSMIEQGRKIYSAIFKRNWRAMKEEFKKLYVLNGLFLSVTGQQFPGGKALREDYLPSPNDIIPAADPEVVSDTQRIQIAAAVAQRAQATAGYNKDEVERNLLKAWRVQGIDILFPGSDKIPAQGEDPKVTVEKLKQQGKQQELQSLHMQFVATLMEEQRVNNAKILELQASALKLSEDAKSEQAWATVAAVEASVKALDSRNGLIMKHIELIMKAIEHDSESANGGRMERMARAAGNNLALTGGSQAPTGLDAGLGVG